MSFSLGPRTVERNGETYDFTDTRETASGGLHHKLALALAEGVGELGLVVLVDEVVEVGLATELVHALRDLVTCGIAKTGEEREELLGGSSGGCVTEKDGVEVALQLVGKKMTVSVVEGEVRGSGGRTEPLLLINRLATVSTGWKMNSSARPKRTFQFPSAQYTEETNQRYQIPRSWQCRSPFLRMGEATF